MHRPWHRPKQPEVSGPHLRISGPGGDRTVPIAGTEIGIGRLPDNDVILRDRSVTGRHARLIATDVGYSIEDSGSSTGTYINGIRLTGARLLKTEDEIRIGAYSLHLLD
ncbi:MAG: FHA domain-containing protein [Dehalococcoidia bacterium]